MPRRLNKTRALVSLWAMRRMNLLLVALCLVTMAAIPPRASMQDTPAAAAPAARTEAQLREALAGSWRLAVPESTARARIDQGIERAVNDMNYFVQDMARSQLVENTNLNRRIDLAFPESQISIHFDQSFLYVTRPGARQTFPLPDGSVVVRQYFRSGHLEQYFEATLGRRWNVYRLSADGQTLTVSATQQGTMMPTPMQFELPYHRAP